MQAVVLRKTGGPEGMALEEVPTPEVNEGRVLVRVRACGVAHRDVIERSGGNRLLSPPIVQGHEFAGEIVEIGPGVQRWQRGDRVVNLYTDSCGTCEHCTGGEERLCPGVTEAYGLTVNGGYAQFAVVRERGLEALPDGIPWEQAAILMSAVGVGYNNVVTTAAVRPDEHVLVTGATGGVGLAAVETARLIGARVWAVTSSPAKKAQLEAMGLEHVLVDDTGSFHKMVRERRPQGVDAVIDCVGAPTLHASIRSLRRFGRVAVVGTLEQARVELALGYTVINSIKILGSDNVSRQALREVMALAAEGRLSARVDRVLPLGQAAEAHQLIEDRKAFGRIVLVPDHD